jgi:hypothetical protein
MKLLAEGNERGGGTATATIACQLVSIEGGTDVQFESSVDLTGKLIQVGRGMIEGVAGQIVKKYIANVRKMLEVEAPADGAAPASAAASSAAGETAAQAAPAAHTAIPPQEDSINMGAIVFKALWMSIVNFFKRLIGRG